MTTPQDEDSEILQSKEERRQAILKAVARPPSASLDTAYKMVGPVIMGLMLGYAIDQQFQTRPWVMLGMTFFGLLTGFWSILRPLYFSSSQAETRSGDSAEKPPEA